MSTANGWIRPYLKRYLDSIAPHDFPDGTDPDELRAFVEVWVYAFDGSHPPITVEEADAARLRLAMSPPSFRRDHLPAVLAVVRGFRERDAAAQQAAPAAPSPAEVRATDRSRRCPECSTESGPTGFARRRGMWADRSWHASASLYCRCSLGRLRLEMEPASPPPYDDLQALPHLWDWKLSHPSWSDRPSAPPSVEGREWRYLAPGEDAPAPIARAVLPPCAARLRPKSWAGPIPADLPMPRPVPREPMPAPDRAEGEGEVAA